MGVDAIGALRVAQVQRRLRASLHAEAVALPPAAAIDRDRRCGFALALRGAVDGDVDVGLCRGIDEAQAAVVDPQPPELRLHAAGFAENPVADSFGSLFQAKA